MEFRNPSIDVIPITQISLKFKIKGFHYKLLFDSEFSNKAKPCQMDERLNKSGQSNKTIMPRRNAGIFQVARGSVCSYPAFCLPLTNSTTSVYKVHFVPRLPNYYNFLPIFSYFYFHFSGLSTGTILALEDKNQCSQELSNNGESIHFL